MTQRDRELSSSEFALGVDGGGSKTLAVVVDAEGNERGRGVAGSANHTGVGIEQAVQLAGDISSATRAAATILAAAVCRLLRERRMGVGRRPCWLICC
jgi:N-acetylglucosamine kinase-like BadF-type ATPase